MNTNKANGTAVALVGEVIAGATNVVASVVESHKIAKTVAQQVVDGYTRMLFDFMDDPEHQKIIKSNEAWAKSMSKSILYQCAKAYKYQIYNRLSDKKTGKKAFIFRDNSTLIVDGDKLDFGPVVA